METQLFVNGGFEHVESMVKEALTAAGLRVKPTPLGGAQIKAKMSFLTAEKGNELLATWLPFIFKLRNVSLVLSAYTDGTTGVVLREGATVGSGVLGTVAGNMTMGLGATAVKEAQRSALFAEAETRLREKLGSQVVYEGERRPGVEQVPA
jgi:hypothetical protein